jgi:hypothetical protein
MKPWRPSHRLYLYEWRAVPTPSWPETYPGTTLWIIDNLSDTSQAAEILEACGQVRPLITLNSASAGNVPNSFSNVTLGGLAPEAVIKLLGVTNVPKPELGLESGSDAGSDDESQSVAAELAEYVGHSPVVLEMLNGLLSDGETVSDLLGELRKTSVDASEELFGDDESGSGAHVLSTAAITLRRLPRQVRKQIAPLAYVGDAPLSRDLVMSLVAVEGDELLDMFRACSKRSLLSWQGEAIRIHPVVVAAITSLDEGKKGGDKNKGGVGTSFKRAVKKGKGAKGGSLELTLRRARVRIARSNREPDARLRYDVVHYEQILASIRANPDLNAILSVNWLLRITALVALIRP